MKEIIKTVITATVAAIVGADEFNPDCGDEILGLLAREYVGRSMIDDCTEVPGERFELRCITAVWWWHDVEEGDMVLIERRVMAHYNDGLRDDRIRSWNEKVMTREEFISRVMEMAKKLGLDVAWEDYI